MSWHIGDEAQGRLYLVHEMDDASQPASSSDDVDEKTKNRTDEAFDSRFVPLMNENTRNTTTPYVKHMAKRTLWVSSSRSCEHFFTNEFTLVDK